MRKAAEGKFARELHSASQINDPWSRAVALARVLEQTPDTEVQRVAEMALKATKENKDAYKRVAVTAWVFYALIQCHKEAMVSQHLPGVLADAQLIAPPPSQVEALYVVWSAVGAIPKLSQLVLSVLIQACAAANSWRAGRVMKIVIRTVAEKDRAYAERLWERMPNSQYKRQARRLLDATRTDSKS